jgi:hypothetical protein
MSDKVIAYDVNCEVCQQVSWDRTYSVFKYLRKKVSIPFVLYFDMRHKSTGGDHSPNYRLGLSHLPEPPLPCYSYHRLTKEDVKGNIK